MRELHQQPLGVLYPAKEILTLGDNLIIWTTKDCMNFLRPTKNTKDLR